MHRVRLCGSSRGFLEDFKSLIEDCGFIASEKAEGGFLEPCVYEANGMEGLTAIADAANGEPFVVYSRVEFPHEALLPFREKGLIGAVTPKSSPEDIAFLINKAIFCGKMLKRNLRVPLSLPVEITFVKRKISATSSLLSRDGMFIVTLNPLPVNAVCELSFTIPGLDKRIETKGRVLYNIQVNRDLSIISDPRDPFKRLVAHPGMAVFFTDLPEEERDAIDGYLKTIE